MMRYFTMQMGVVMVIQFPNYYISGLIVKVNNEELHFYKAPYSQLDFC